MRVSPSASEIAFRKESKEEHKRRPLKKKLYRNGDTIVSGIATVGGLASGLVSGTNPTFLYPLYARLFSWDFPNQLSAYKRAKTGIEDSRREFTDSKVFAHLSYASTAWIGPPASQFIPQFFNNDSTVKTFSSIIGATQGLINIILMKYLRSKVSANKASMNFNEHIHQEISNHINNVYLGPVSRKENLKNKLVKHKIYREIFDPKKIEIAIRKARNHSAQQSTNNLKSVDQKPKQPLGLPRINLQHLMTTAIAAGFLYINRQGIDPHTNRDVGNPMVQVGCASRLMTALYQMVYEPVFETRDRSFMNDFWSLKAGHTKSDIITIAIFGLSNPIAKYIVGQNALNTQKVGLYGHGVAMAAAAAIGGIANIVTPILKHHLDSDETKAKDASTELKNILNDKVDDIDDLSKISDQEIVERIKLTPQLYQQLPDIYPPALRN